MNLSLRTQGKHSAEAAESDILQVLNDLLECHSTQVRTYVNGTLYSILTCAGLKERAMAMGMDEILHQLMETQYTHPDDQFRRQIQYILEQLHATPVDDANSDDEEDDDEDVEDDIEETSDLEEAIGPESIRAKANEDCGEKMLCALYLRTSGDATQSAQKEVKAVTQTSAEHETTKQQQRIERAQPQHHFSSTIGIPLQRPTTPAFLLRPTTPAYSASAREVVDTQEHVPDEFKSKSKIPRTPSQFTARLGAAAGGDAKLGFLPHVSARYTGRTTGRDKVVATGRDTTLGRSHYEAAEAKSEVKEEGGGGGGGVAGGVTKDNNKEVVDSTARVLHAAESKHAEDGGTTTTTEMPAPVQAAAKKGRDGLSLAALVDAPDITGEEVFATRSKVPRTPMSSVESATLGIYLLPLGLSNSDSYQYFSF